jgi:8-oxo-dGTP pyrophosphatase MutT (NUDIX family)
MSYLRHVLLCNRFDPQKFLPLCLDGRRIGLVRRDHAAALETYPAVFKASNGMIDLMPHLAGREVMTEAMAEAVESLIDRELIPAARNEMFAVSEHWGGATLFEVDRSALPFFGFRAYGVHVNGIRSGVEPLTLWIGRRAKDKKVAPGKLDNLIAGGISAGYGVRETLIKEAGEEANVPASLAAQAKPAGALFYRMEEEGGLRNDVLYVYDLELPPQFEPLNTDGEIEDFRVLSLAKCLEKVAESDDFKFNVNLVLIDLAIRRGVIGPEHPEYLDLVAGLRGSVSLKPYAGTNFGG